MAYQALYRTYRPTTFGEIVGQDHIIQTLSNALTTEKIAHAYLFCGPRGTGKTSVAKLLAKSVNCTTPNELICNHCQNCEAALNNTHPDVVEIDAASNNGVDEIRDLIEKVKYSPLLGKYKIYIIDEVHMLSTGAFNALLKTLEEPPAHVIFILATTEPHKVLPTIISRCQRYDFVKVTTAAMEGMMERVLAQEKIDYEPEALTLISSLADGGMRDALSILDQGISYSEGKLSAAEIRTVYGITTYEDKLQFLTLAFQREISELLRLIRYFDEKGIDIRRLTMDLIKILKDITIYLQTNSLEFTNLNNHPQLEALLAELTPASTLDFLAILLDTNNDYRFSSNVITQFELAILKFAVYDIAQVEVERTPEITSASPTSQITPNNSTVEAPKAQPAKDKQLAALAYDEEVYLGLLVGANKQQRERINAHWSQLKQYELDLKFSRLAKAFSNCTVLAVGANYIILVSTFNALTIEINNFALTDTLVFTQQVFQQPYQVFAINDKQQQQLLTAFKARQQANSLPEAYKITFEVPKTTKTAPATTETKILDLFGEGLVEIIDE